MKTGIQKHILVDTREIQSLVKAEWSVIRKCQNLILDEWGTVTKTRFPDSCCGMLFKGNYGYASNGHWMLKVRTDGPSIDPEVKYFFYSYLDDEVYENYNPFSDVGVDIEDFHSVIQQWKIYNLKIRVEDLINTIEENVSIVRHRRKVAFHAGYDSETNELGVRLEFKKGGTKLVRVPVYSYKLPGFPEFSVNLSYIHKIVLVVAPYFNVIDLCFDGGDSPLIIKAKNGFQGKPDIRFALGQYHLQEAY